MGNGYDPKSGTFPRNGIQLCAVLANKCSSVEIQQALSWYLFE